MRKIVKAADIMLLAGKSRRQASRILADIRKETGKEKHRHITVRDVAKYYKLDEDERQRVLDYNDN